jgi:hypothetical protein
MKFSRIRLMEHLALDCRLSLRLISPLMTARPQAEIGRVIGGERGTAVKVVKLAAPTTEANRDFTRQEWTAGERTVLKVAKGKLAGFTGGGGLGHD